MKNVAGSLTARGVCFQGQHHSVAKTTQDDRIVAGTQWGGIDQNVIKGHPQLSHAGAHSFRTKHGEARLRRGTTAYHPEVAGPAVNVVADRPRSCERIGEAMVILCT